MLEMPILETVRLLVRPFQMDDLAAAHRLFDIELQDAALHTDKMESLAERTEWLQWAARSSRQLAILYQPPYGDRAVILKSSHELIGSAGLVPCLAPFEQLPSFARNGLEAIRNNDFSRSLTAKPTLSFKSPGRRWSERYGSNRCCSGRRCSIPASR